MEITAEESCPIRFRQTSQSYVEVWYRLKLKNSSRLELFVCPVCSSGSGALCLDFKGT